MTNYAEKKEKNGKKIRRSIDTAIDIFEPNASD